MHGFEFDEHIAKSPSAVFDVSGFSVPRILGDEQ